MGSSFNIFLKLFVYIFTLVLQLFKSTCTQKSGSASRRATPHTLFDHAPSYTPGVYASFDIFGDIFLTLPVSSPSSSILLTRCLRRVILTCISSSKIASNCSLLLCQNHWKSIVQPEQLPPQQIIPRQCGTATAAYCFTLNKSFKS